MRGWDENLLKKRTVNPPSPPSSKLKPASRRRIETEDIGGGGRGAEAWNDFAANNNRGRKVDA